jgi:hypothetical protein
MSLGKSKKIMVVLPLVLYGCETVFLFLFCIFGNRGLKRVLETKQQKIETAVRSSIISTPHKTLLG